MAAIWALPPTVQSTHQSSTVIPAPISVTSTRRQIVYTIVLKLAIISIPQVRRGITCLNNTLYHVHEDMYTAIIRGSSLPTRLFNLIKEVEFIIVIKKMDTLHDLLLKRFEIGSILLSLSLGHSTMRHYIPPIHLLIRSKSSALFRLNVSMPLALARLIAVAVPPLGLPCLSNRVHAINILEGWSSVFPNTWNTFRVCIFLAPLLHTSQAGWTAIAIPSAIASVWKCISLGRMFKQPCESL